MGEGVECSGRSLQRERSGKAGRGENEAVDRGMEDMGSRDDWTVGRVSVW